MAFSLPEDKSQRSVLSLEVQNFLQQLLRPWFQSILLNWVLQYTIEDGKKIWSTDDSYYFKFIVYLSFEKSLNKWEDEIEQIFREFPLKFSLCQDDCRKTDFAWPNSTIFSRWILSERNPSLIWQVGRSLNCAKKDKQAHKLVLDFSKRNRKT